MPTKDNIEAFDRYIEKFSESQEPDMSAADRWLERERKRSSAQIAI